MFKFNFSIPETMYEKYGWDFETDWDLDITGFRVYGKTQRITMQVGGLEPRKLRARQAPDCTRTQEQEASLMRRGRMLQ